MADACTNLTVITHANKASASNTAWEIVKTIKGKSVVVAQVRAPVTKLALHFSPWQAKPYYEGSNPSSIGIA